MADIAGLPQLIAAIAEPLGITGDLSRRLQKEVTSVARERAVVAVIAAL